VEDLFARMYCSNSGVPMLARFRDNGKHIVLMLTTIMGPRAARNTSLACVTINKPAQLDEGYTGCASCGASSFFKCHICESLSCWLGGNSGFCPKCSATRTISGAISSFDIGQG